MFDYIFLDEGVSEMETLERVKAFFPQVPVKKVSSKEEVLRHVDYSSEARAVASGKRILYLNNFRGELVKFCPARSVGDYRCCNLHTVNLMSNCIFNCVYCILQNCLNNPVIQVHCNIKEICGSLAAFDQTMTDPMRICTGEIADSLAMDHIFKHTASLIPFFNQTEKLYLELKTKSDNVETLKDAPPSERVIVSFSLSPQDVISSLEFGTASLEGRLQAAERVLSYGYKVAFNIDPMIETADFRIDYGGLYAEIFRRFRPEQISWFHIGSLRFVGGLDGVARCRFPGLTVFDSEFVCGPDGKYRYPRPLRDEMYAFALNILREKAPDVPVFFCTERESFWHRHFGWRPAGVEDVNRHIMQNFGKKEK
jgi:spore photoproduct lyase